MKVAVRSEHTGEIPSVDGLEAGLVQLPLVRLLVGTCSPASLHEAPHEFGSSLLRHVGSGIKHTSHPARSVVVAPVQEASHDAKPRPAVRVLVVFPGFLGLFGLVATELLAQKNDLAFPLA